MLLLYTRFEDDYIYTARRADLIFSENLSYCQNGETAKHGHGPYLQHEFWKGSRFTDQHPAYSS
jgi:hypothetical protein